MKNGTKYTLIDPALKPAETDHITGQVVAYDATEDLAELSFWNADHSGIVYAQFYGHQLTLATWRERLESSRDTVQRDFAGLESELRETFVIPNSLLPEDLHEKRASDGQTIAELEKRMNGSQQTGTMAVDEKTDRAQRVELYAGQIAAGQEITYRPRVQRVVDDLNPALAHLFGVDENPHEYDDSELTLAE